MLVFPLAPQKVLGLHVIRSGVNHADPLEGDEYSWSLSWMDNVVLYSNHHRHRWMDSLFEHGTNDGLSVSSKDVLVQSPCRLEEASQLIQKENASNCRSEDVLVHRHALGDE